VYQIVVIGEDKLMPLQAVPGDLNGTTGAKETIQIVAVTPNMTVTIASIIYGSKPVTLNADGQSFDITILAGTNRLQVTLFSPDNTNGSAAARQSLGGAITALDDDIEFVGGVAVWSPDIVGA
jgi:hypothetical protein